MSYSDPVLRVVSNIGAVKLDQLDDRICLQKLGYIIQQIHRGDSFDFSWYVRGPYSSSLATALFRHEERGTFRIPPRLSEHEADTKKRVGELLGKDICDPHSLELYASLWYLMSGKRISSREKDSIIAIMCREKPHLDRRDIESALAKISKFRQKHSI